MTARELIEALTKVPPDTEIHCRAGSNDIGTIWSPSTVELSEAHFFGNPYPTVIIEHSRPGVWSRPSPEQGEVLWQYLTDEEAAPV